MPRIVNNVGVGLVEATFLNLTTTGSDATQRAFNETLLDAQQVAAVIQGNNEICYLTTTAPLFGAVVALSENLNQRNNSVPEKAVVQISGVATMQGTTGQVAPAVARNRRPYALNSFVTQGTTTITNISLDTRGKVINVWDTDRVDVMF